MNITLINTINIVLKRMLNDKLSGLNKPIVRSANDSFEESEKIIVKKEDFVLIIFYIICIYTCFFWLATLHAATF